MMPVLESTSPTPLPSLPPRQSTSPVDCYSVGGIRLALAGDLPADTAAVKRQLGEMSVTSATAADLTIRFVDRLKIAAPARSLGDDVWVDSESFSITGAGRGGRDRRMEIPFDRLGPGCEIVCERGFRNIPLLGDLVNLVSLSKGLLPVHASAFAYQSSRALVVGCADGGKTGALLAFMGLGAKFIADDWAYWNVTEETLSGLSGNIRVRDRYLAQLPELGRTATWRERQRLRALRTASTALQRLRRAVPMADRIRFAVDRRRCIHASAERLFGDARLPGCAAPNVVFLIRHHDAPQVSVEELSREAAVRGIAFVMEGELAAVRECYRKFRFAFPHANNPLLEDIESLLRARVDQALRGAQTYEVCYPDPTPLELLVKALHPYLAACRSGGQ